MNKDRKITGTGGARPGGRALRETSDGLVWSAAPVSAELESRWSSRVATLSAADEPHWVPIAGFETDPNAARLVMQPPKGDPLAEVVQRGRLRPSGFLGLAVSMTRAVLGLHNRRIPHGHVSAHAFFVKTGGNEVYLALHPDCMTQPPGRPSEIHGHDLTEMSVAAPEQTGRTERIPDLRADLYALGAVFYQMLAGAAPFQALDEAELVHQILAVAPRRLTELRSDVPAQIGAIIHKLLEKSPDARYQSAFGLLSDLRQADEAFDQTGDVPTFELGARDAMSSFRIPDKLYGRANEERIIETAIEEMHAGGTGFLFLAGRSGTGKSALAARIRDWVGAEGNAIFLSGKYEELQSLPYLAILDAFRDFVLLKVARGGQELEMYRRRVLEGLGENIGIIAEFLPELRHVVGDRSEDGPTDPIERNQRFRIGVQAFCEVMADPNNPVVLFLDDLQWAEGASVELLEDVFRTAQLPHVLVVGAYRDNEPGATERVARLDAAITDGGLAARHIAVRPLDHVDTLEMIADAMHLEEASAVEDLSRVVHAKTQGNAFHLRRLLTALYQEGAIRFDMDTGTWGWVMDSITRHVVDADVAFLMTERIELLSAPALETLRFAACFGTTFSIDALQILSERAEAELAALLEEAVDEGFVEHPADGSGQYSFSHDIVRMAAYQQTPAEDVAALHHQIGARLLREMDDLQTDNRLFATLDHIILGRELLQDPPVGRLVIKAALVAAFRAKALAAYDMGERYLRTAAEIPVEHGGVNWETEPDDTARLRLEMMEATFLLSGYDAAEPLFAELLEHLPTVQRKARVYQVLVTLFMFRSNYDRALEFGIEGLKLLGVRLDPPYSPKIGQQLALSQIALRKHDVFDFSALPDMDNAASEQIIEMLMIVSTPAFLTNKDLFVLMSLRMLRITLKDGMTSPGLFSIQSFAVVNYIAFGAVERAYRIGSNLFPLLEKRNISQQVRGRLYYTSCIVLGWHYRSYEDLHRMMSDGIKHSWAAADLEYVGYFYYGMLKYTWVGCKPLAALVDELNSFDRYQKRLDHQVLTGITSIYRRAVERLTGEETERLWSETDASLGEKMLGEAEVGSFLTTELLLTHIFQDWSVVRHLYEKLLVEKEFTTLGPEFVDYHLLCGLSMTRSPEFALGIGPLWRKRRLAKHHKALTRLATKFPVNHGFHHLILEGEIARSKGRYAEAIAVMSNGVSRAEAAGIWSYAGIGSECAAEAAEQLGDPGQRDIWLERASRAYSTWGAVSKVHALDRSTAQIASDVGGPSARLPARGLDLSTIVKASQAILEITDIDTLLKRFLAIAIENAGANLGQLYLRRDDEFVLAAEADTAEGDVRIRLNKPQPPLETLLVRTHPREIVTRIATTRSALIVADAGAAPELNRDRYVRRSKPKSLFVMPIIGNGEVQGVLHLENTLAAGVFTEDRQELISTIMSLASISLTNAMLYARQEEALEIEMRASRELARVNRLKDEFLANTSHELRTPLNGIIGLADSMIGGANGPMADAAAQTLKLIASSGRRLSGLVDDILDFSRLKDGDIDILLEPIDLRATVDVVFKLMERRADDAGLTLKNAIPRNVPNVLGDEDRLQQILFNLTENAAKFAPDGLLEVSFKAGEDRAEITVSDTGPGIEPEMKSVIFSGFEQIDASTRRKSDGLGLGLAITRRLVELHGGNIAEVGTSGRGAKFVFDLAVTDAEVDEERERIVSLAAFAEPEMATLTPSASGVFVTPDADKIRVTGQKALLVDDDAVNLQVLQNFMALEGYQTKSAQDGESALRLIAEGYEPDIVLLDVMMPRMSGYEVCAKLRETHPAARLPIVMLTAKNRLQDLRSGFDAGATDYLAKPFSRDELAARMQAHLSLTKVSNAYGRFVPVEFLDFLQRDSILDIDLGDNVSRHMTVMFTDIREYTSIAEALSPDDSFRFLNDYYGRMGPIVQENNGVVSQFVGDGMMALFAGTPIDATRAAVEMQRELRRINVDRAALGAKPLGTGIGLHCGDLIMGILGDRYRLSGNVVSDTVNAAARLETLTAQCGISVAVSGEVRDALPDDLMSHSRHITRVLMVGKSKPIDVHEIFASDTAQNIRMKQDTRDAFEAAGRLMRRGRFDEARGAFGKLAEANPEDRAAKWLQDRVGLLIQTGAAEGWQGSDVLQKK